MGKRSGKMKKLVMIGPVYPYKGGIAHYTGLMYQALSKKYDVKMISFKMQYPRLLYKSEQKDYSNERFKIDNTEYILHTANPINIISVARRINKEQADAVIIPWWHPYFTPCYWLLTTFLRNTKVVYVCHNVFPHERFPADRLLTKLTLRKGDAFIVQSKMDAADLLKVKKSPKYRNTPHPTYNAFKIKNMSKEEARKLISLADTEKVLLFFGFVREYKGLKHLLRAMPEIVERYPETKLLVVGDFGTDREQYVELIKLHEMEQHIILQEGYIPDEEVEKYFAACDLVVLPYESATQSGIVQIAYGFDKPVIVTNVGGLPDVVEDGKTGYVVEKMNSSAIAKAVVKYFAEEKQCEFTANVKNEEYRFSWDRMVETVEDLLQ